MYSYKSLNNISYNEISKCLNLAFSDYYFPIQLTDEQLKHYFEMNGIKKELSYGAFMENEMVGFILNSSHIYNKEKVAFNVAAGVIPQHRENKVFTNLFNFAEQEIKKHKIKKYYLEVLKQNDKAIYLYKKHGFNITREFSILNLSNYNKETINQEVIYIDFNDFEINNINAYNHLKSLYENSIDILKTNSNFYNVAYMQDENTIHTFCIFSKQDGHIVQVAYTDINKLKFVIQGLFSKFNNVTIKNIDIAYSDLLETLYSIGFNEVCRQFEMVKTIC